MDSERTAQTIAQLKLEVRNLEAKEQRYKVSFAKPISQAMAKIRALENGG